jgi:hypothetical protein
MKFRVAQHKNTGEMISAARLVLDATWVGRKDDEWLVPRYLVEDYKLLGDIKLIWVKNYIHEDGSPVSCHFRRISSEDRNISNLENESPEHKMAKEGVWEAICNKEILIENIPLWDIISNIEFEEPISISKKSKIADVLTIFKEWHPVYGKGIVFEVQFSNQNKEITEDRTFNRVSEGYSVCWLWDKHFNDNYKLKKVIDENNLKKNKIIEIEIIPFSKAQELYQDKLNISFNNKINNLGIVIDHKICEMNIKSKEVEKQYYRMASQSLESFREVAKNELKWIDEAKDNINLEASNKIKEIRENLDGLIIELKNLKKDIEKEAIEKTSLDVKELNEKLKEDLMIEFNRIKEELSKKLLIQMENNYKFQDEIRFRLFDFIKRKVDENVDRPIIFSTIETHIINYLKNIDIKPLIDSAFEKNIHIENGKFLKCKSCNNIIEIKEAQYQSGWSYCEKCFNALPTNWQKEKLLEIKMEDELKKRKDGQNKIN